MEGNGLPWQPRLKARGAYSKACPLVRVYWLHEAQGLVPYTEVTMWVMSLPLPRQGHPQEASSGLKNLHRILGQLPPAARPQRSLQSVSVTEGLCGTVLCAPDRESQGLWGQERRVSHCLAWWQGHRGKVELGGWTRMGDLARFCQ